MSYFYHGTYRAYLNNILREGLRPNMPKSWNYPCFGNVYVCDNPNDAESFAEAADNVPENIFNSGIVVLQVDVDGLALRPDENVLECPDESPYCWQYAGIIAPSRLKVFLNE